MRQSNGWVAVWVGAAEPHLVGPKLWSWDGALRGAVVRFGMVRSYSSVVSRLDLRLMWHWSQHLTPEGRD